MNPARFLLPVRGAGVRMGCQGDLIDRQDVCNLSRGDRVKSPDCLLLELRPAFGSGGFSGGKGIRAGWRVSAVPTGSGTSGRGNSCQPRTGMERTPWQGESLAVFDVCPKAGDGSTPVPGNAILAFAHSGRIGTAEAGRNQPLATGGFRDPGRTREDCATARHSSGATSAKTKTTEMTK